MKGSEKNKECYLELTFNISFLLFFLHMNLNGGGLMECLKLVGLTEKHS